MTSAEMIPTVILKKTAVVYVRQSTQSQVMTNLESQSASSQPLMPAATLYLSKRHLCQKGAKYFSLGEKSFSRQLLAPAFCLFFPAHYGIRTRTGIVAPLQKNTLALRVLELAAGKTCYPS